jgi:cysteine synthase
MANSADSPLSAAFFTSVGNTPLIRLRNLSNQTGCEILGKAEFLNPGGSVKDRAAASMMSAAWRAGTIQSGGLVVEGTAGNTGIALTLAARACGMRALIVIPETQSPEKFDALRALGAELELVPAVPFANPQNYYHVAKRRALERGGFWADQFENMHNARAHFETTGPEIWLQSSGKLDGFICAAGTGGTIGGISKYLKQKRPELHAYLIDCEGSSLFNYVTTGALDADGSSIMEGIGIRRITRNFAEAQLDGAFTGTDREAVVMAHRMLREEGLFLGGSAALNCVGAVKLAEKLGPGHTVATILCDGGGRYQNRLYHAPWLQERGFSEVL